MASPVISVMLVVPDARQPRPRVEADRASAQSSTLRFENGVPKVQDGPFADTKEQVGGTFVLDVTDRRASEAGAPHRPSEW